LLEDFRQDLFFARVSAAAKAIGRLESIPSGPKPARGTSGRGATFSGSNLIFDRKNPGRVRTQRFPGATSSCSCTQINRAFENMA
jgi:hypothetical protein